MAKRSLQAFHSKAAREVMERMMMQKSIMLVAKAAVYPQIETVVIVVARLVIEMEAAAAAVKVWN